ncbi:hypothetical protein L486_00795 [Kwoniella mangroviensis CBS 10435]|uniref:Uncharacterized protein n=1 Tax=Kwoniella mangroviensis CBS 10435 TaxID=1331196 RepID=A0A1B9J041_9TREE|nr:uncharacterized protein I203_04327 [Kwoniella mangroviensis CBS 8507]OCF61151.1 hypothetical protein L486_00795 [Kwoniella mangroviensis CBS 10435]OCF66751.1 hypothetical protein I203_04327 [Kwoniella mangroviensis CBS 8507]OCF74102.1 hypothetical protein I204_04472 [Kwoniella mangroviensis CBS 8886]
MSEMNSQLERESLEYLHIKLSDQLIRPHAIGQFESRESIQSKLQAIERKLASLEPIAVTYQDRTFHLRSSLEANLHPDRLSEKIGKLAEEYNRSMLTIQNYQTSKYLSQINGEDTKCWDERVEKEESRLWEIEEEILKVSLEGISEVELNKDAG